MTHVEVYAALRDLAQEVAGAARGWRPCGIELYEDRDGDLVAAQVLVDGLRQGVEIEPALFGVPVRVTVSMDPITSMPPRSCGVMAWERDKPGVAPHGMRFYRGDLMLMADGGIPGSPCLAGDGLVWWSASPDALRHLPGLEMTLWNCHRQNHWQRGDATAPLDRIRVQHWPVPDKGPASFRPSSEYYLPDAEEIEMARGELSDVYQGGDARQE